MFTAITMEDWQKNPTPEALVEAIRLYKASDDFNDAREAQAYYDADGTKVESKVIMKAEIITTQVEGETHDTYANEEVIGNRIVSDFFSTFVDQEASFLLGNGVTLDDPKHKGALGKGFDTALAQIGESALIQKVCWGYWNHDHIEQIDAYKDDLSGAFAILDEMTSDPGIFVQFWQLSSNRPQYIRLFEPDGVTLFKNDDGNITVKEEKRAYILTTATDSIGTREVGQRNYDRLPIIPLFANKDGTGRLKKSIKTKIDLYDKVISDFGDNLDQANDIYWILNNYGGNDKQIQAMLKRIHELRAVVNVSDGMNASTAEPHTFEVPYAARATALDLLRKQLYKDAKALDMDELTGGSLTNVAIEAAMTNLNLKCDKFEWCVFKFVQGILALQGIETEGINFVRRALANQTETITAIYQCRGDIDRRTALQLNPMINPDQIDTIIENLEAEEATGMPSMDDLQNALDEPDEKEPEE